MRRALPGFVDSLALLVKTAAVKHLDETGFRVGGKTQWLHVACTLWLSFYRVSPKRGSLLDGVTGIMVHDHWKPYYTMKGVLHALWNAHHLRELQALVEIEKEPWAFRMQRLLRRTGHNLLLRLTTRKDDVLRFLTDPTVPFTNNLTEQAVRMMKLRQKISGGFRSEEGAGDFAVIRSFIATAKKQGWNLIHALTQDPTTLVQHLRLA